VDLRNTILVGDALEQLRTLPDESVHCVVTSPPYWGLRDYNEPGQLGLEPTPEEYVAKMVEVFRDVRRVLRGDGTCWVNLGDSYAGGGGGNYGSGMSVSAHKTHPTASKDKPKTPPGLKPKDLVGIPWRVAFALQADGWYLRSDIIWAKPNPMPESVTDRPMKAHEYLFLLSKAPRYFYDADAVREESKPSGWDRQRAKGEDTWKYGRAAGGDPNSTNGIGGTTPHGAGRNRRTVWTIATKPYSGAHFAVMPPALVAPCIQAGCPDGGVVLDPFFGAGTVGLVARENGRDYIGIELNPGYAALAEARIVNRGRRVEDVSLPGQRDLF